jgi:hypothetical protein
MAGVRDRAAPEPRPSARQICRSVLALLGIGTIVFVTGVMRAMARLWRVRRHPSSSTVVRALALTLRQRAAVVHAHPPWVRS